MNNQPEIAIIGGTGVYDPHMLSQIRLLEIETPFGAVECKIGDYAGKTVVFIARHGSLHSIAPHKINYRANIWALKKLGIQTIISTTAVGSLNDRFKPGDFVFPDQILDYSKNREHTFFPGGDRGVVHVDFTHPFCRDLIRFATDIARELPHAFHTGGCYVCTEGPRFETTAEIKAYRLLGGDLVGMTGMPEAVLAREAEMCYMTISMVTNFAAGISPVLLTHREVYEVMRHNGENIRQLLSHIIEKLQPGKRCECHSALQEMGGFQL